MEQFSDFVNVVLAASCGSGDATLTVNNGSLLPATGTYSGLLENEIVTVTARSGNTLSVLRGQAGGGPASGHALNTQFKNIITARSLAQFKADILAAIGSTPPIMFTVGLATVGSTDEIPENAIITRVCVLVTSSYNSGVLISVGQPGSSALLVPPTGTGSFTPIAGLYDFPMLTPWGGDPLTVLVTLGGSAAVSGACTVFVEYALPGD